MAKFWIVPTDHDPNELTIIGTSNKNAPPNAIAEAPKVDGKYIERVSDVKIVDQNIDGKNVKVAVINEAARNARLQQDASDENSRQQMLADKRALRQDLMNKNFKAMTTLQEAIDALEQFRDLFLKE